MAPIRLSTTSHLTMAMIALRGPSTPYQLERAVGRTVGHFWRFSRSQFYDEPERLAAAGLLRERRERSGRRRRTFSLTEAGREAVREWLAEPAGESFEIRDLGQLKLFFAEVGRPGTTQALASEQAQLARERLDEFERMAADLDGVDFPPTRVAPLHLGLAMTRAAVVFWEELERGAPASPRRRAAASGPAGG